MFGKTAAILGIAVGVLAISATSAMAHTLKVTVTATCACEYTFTATGNSDANVPVRVNYAFVVTSNGVEYPVSGHFDTTTDANGDFSIDTISGLSLPGGCTDTVFFSSGSASLTANGQPVLDTDVTVDLPGTLFCSTTPPPPGKVLAIGPSSMEGHLLIRPGDWINGGYSFVFVNGGHAATTVTVSSTLTLPFRCANGTTGQFVINLGTHDYDVPAGNKTWQPTGDANSVLSWAGAGMAPDGCGPGNIMDNSKGAIWTATISQNPDTGSLLNWRFKYRDPNAKGKGNVNCLDLSDPRRNKADVCGASWSETVKDP
jgi:hypothetical protein